MTENGGDNSNPKDVPPAGMLVQAAASEPEVKPAAPVKAQPSYPAVDPNYKEPATFEALRDACAAACRNVAASKSIEELAVNANALAEQTMTVMRRLNDLMGAAMPFAKQATHMANTKMVLAGEGRAKEPAGGVWLNGTRGGQLQPNEHIFYAICDVIGRKATEDALIADFKQIQAAGALVRERAKHLEGSKIPTSREGDAIQNGSASH